MKILAIITARKGSKGIPCKNFRRIAGLSLTDYAINSAREAMKRGYLDGVYVSSDSDYICKRSGELLEDTFPLRDEDISSDETKSIDVVKNVLSLLREKGKEYTDVMILQPTSPLRTADDICMAIEKYRNCASSNSLISISPMDYVNPNGLYFADESFATPLLRSHNSGTRRQDLPTLYLRNGAIFITNIEYLNQYNTLISETPACYKMSKERATNIDTYEDLEQASNYLTTGEPEVLSLTGGLELFTELKKLAKKNIGLQIVYVPLFYKAVSYCKGQSFEKNIGVIEYWENNLYLDGENVFDKGECVTDRVMQMDDIIPYENERAFVMDEINALIKGTKAIIVEKGEDAPKKIEKAMAFIKKF